MPSEPKEEMVKMTVHVPKSIHYWAKVCAATEGKDMREVVIDALNRYLREHKGMKELERYLKRGRKR